MMNHSKNCAVLRATILLLFTTLAGCTVGPDYVRPSIATPAAYKEGVNWKIAEPQDEIARDKWWTFYGDAYLNSLVEQVALSNQNIKIAEAQYRQALALIQQSQAGLFPTLNGGVSASRGQAASNTQTTGAVSNTARVSLSASWELDLWGGIRRTVEANESSAQASAADLQSALLSAQAALVQAYLQLRVNEAQARLLEQTATAYARSQTITQNRYAAGVAARIDVTQADTQLKSTQAQLIDLGVQHAQLEHAIAILLGKPPAEFTLAASASVPAVPRIPLALPSALLERRPDIAAAERRVAAANAQIGVAQAAYFPSLTLSASGGYQGPSFVNLLTLPNRFWSLGPALAATLFDGGARSAQKQQAIAAFDKSIATYRQTVLTGFQEVEDNLATLRILEQEAQVQDQAARSAAESAAIVNNQYQAGTVSYLNVVIAQATSLSAERSSLDLTSRRLVASVTLLKAMGGGWKADAIK